MDEIRLEELRRLAAKTDLNDRKLAEYLAARPDTGGPGRRRVAPYAGVSTLLRGLRGLSPVGGDVVEVAPPYDPSGNTALVAATMLWEILRLLAEAVEQRRQT